MKISICIWIEALRRIVELRRASEFMSTVEETTD